MRDLRVVLGLSLFVATFVLCLGLVAGRPVDQLSGPFVWGLVSGAALAWAVTALVPDRRGG